MVPLALILVYFLFFRGEKGEINALVFTATEGFRHDSIESGIDAIKQLGQEHGFNVLATEDAEVFRESFLQDYNVVIFLNTTGDILNDAQQIEFNRFIQAGGGFVGVHAAADTEYDWPWYGELVGGWFESHPMDPNVREGIVQVVDADHIAAAGLSSTWEKVDEWYDYQSISPEASVLLNVDESSYKKADENPATSPRPISWYREFDGGTSFYTGLGHTADSYEDPLYLSHLWGGIQYASGEGARVNYNNATVAPEENRYLKQVLVNNLNEPMELDLLGNGRIIFVERGGAVKIHDENTGTTADIATLNVFSDLEEGLLGVAADPDYATNNWIYLSYSAPDIAEIRVSRFVLTGDMLDLASEKILLSLPVQRDECCHVAGSIEFGPNGNLFFSMGDNTSPRDTGYGPIDEREGRSPWDAQKSSSNTADLRGSIMRITPEADGTYSIPDGNLFPKDGSGGRPEIYVMGNRNPFRISIDQRTGYLYWGEVGPDAGQDSTTRGSMGYDEVNQAREAGFFGWPYFIGDNQAYADYDYETDSIYGFFDVNKPVNTSPNNTGVTELPPPQEAFLWYPYGHSAEFPLMGSAGRSATGGPVFRQADFPESDKRFPAYYEGKWLITEFMRGWIMAVTMDENGDYVSMEPFLPKENFSSAIDMLFSPDGDLYVLEYGSAWFRGNQNAQIKRIQYNGGNRMPIVQASANTTAGAVPLTLQLSSEGTIDYDQDPLSYKWTVESSNGFSEILEGAQPEIVLTEAGIYTVRLNVEDNQGNSNEQQFEVIAGNEPPQVDIHITAGNKTFFFPDSRLAYQIEVKDKEDGSLAAGIKAEEVAVNFDYAPEGFDPIEIAQNHRSTDDWVTFSKGKSLIDNSDCFSCHRIDVKSIGPSYKQVAEKYKRDKKGQEIIAEKIIKGGVGVWGEHAMSAHPDISPQQAALMVDYIMSLNDPKPVAPIIPLAGTYTTSVPDKENGKGGYLLRAAYQDKGANDLKTLTAEKIIALRNPVINPEHFDAAEGTQLLTTPRRLFNIVKDGAWLAYQQLDMTGVSQIAISAEAPVRNGAAGGIIELHLDAPDGKLIGTTEKVAPLTIDVQAELQKLRAAWEKEGKVGPRPNGGTVRALFQKDYTFDVSQLNDLQDIYLVFKNPDVKAGQILVQMNKITFKNESDLIQ